MSKFFDVMSSVLYESFEQAICTIQQIKLIQPPQEYPYIPSVEYAILVDSSRVHYSVWHSGTCE